MKEGEEGLASGSPRVLKDRYELQEILGHGAFAVTHRARDRQTGEDCVVKEVLYRKIEDPKVLELLEREARVLAHLKHPRIPRFVEFFSERMDGETRLYLAQGYVPGRSLAQLAQAGRHFTEAEVVGIGLQVARILAYLHDLRPPIVHRDVKPGNVVLDPQGEAWLVDFGAVRDRILHEVRTEGEGATIVGTYGYMPYEQFQGRALPASDLYALGMTLVFLLSHKEPHEIEAVSGRVELEPHLRASPALLRVLARMIEPQPEDRYANAALLCADLEEVAATPTGHPGRRRGPHRIALGLGAAALGLLLAARLARQTSPPVTPPAARGWVTPAETPRPPVTPPTAAGPPALPRNLQVLGFSVAGRLTHDGQALETLTRERAEFWLRHEERGEALPAIVSYRDGHFVAGALPKGRIGFQVNVNLNPSNPLTYPGDLTAWKTFEVGSSRDALTIDLLKVIRLLSPQDNGIPMPGWGEDCGQMFATDAPRFAWEAPAEGLTYDYRIERVECPYSSRGEVARGTTSATSVTVPLPPSAANDFYLFTLHAKRGERTVAYITTHGLRGGLGWDYRFRVR